MELIILSQEQAIHFRPVKGNKTVLIRIHDPNEIVKTPVFEELFDDIVHLTFHDVVPKEYLPSNIKYFELSHADRVISFVNDYIDAHTIVIHCHAGISRSPALAIGIAWIIKNDYLQNKILESGKYIPNPHVLNVMAEALGVRETKKNIISKYREVEVDLDKQDIEIEF
ncbi:dual specificity protein phosphatase family protein [Bacillus cereus]|uniref:Tyrosine specific protein phosphatases domain-containing protein n=1 Tax=Bacillus cereus TaxID=1396 RepID=A0A161T986_BACCE|nr:dual specificity protein phosphatase family protein [Bacillus cereus]KZD71157.1 hypothetical protein B4088_0887 [Bacillus cereus]